jgi:uncharacterized membrane protein
VGDIPIQFEHPGWLLLLLLIIPIFLIGRRSVGTQGRIKATAIFAFRVIVILLLTAALTNPTWEQRGEGLTVTVVLDRSNSVPLPLKEFAEEYLRAAAREKPQPEDRIASVIVARDAAIASMPSPQSIVTVGHDEVDRTATNLAAGLRLAMAIMPDDTANRIVLASDGNETIDSVLSAAEIARANNVPVDVLILEYEHQNEVLFDRIIAPARARMGQSISVRLVLRSQGEAEGTVYLRMNGEPLDLDPDAEGYGRYVQLDPGVNVIPLTIRMDDAGPVQFEATFEPASPEFDVIPDNNHAIGVVFVASEGRVLIVDEDPSETEALARALRASEIAVERHPPDALAGGLVFLTGFDAVILANVPRWSFDDEQDRMLHAYVHDLGGGLVMLGGPQSFGAGGWIDSELAKAMPVRMDPPQTRQMPRGALALIMHSCEMPQGNFWSQETARAAINALSRLDYIGIVEYNWAVRENRGATWAFPMQLAGDKQAALAATRQLVVGDTKDFGPLMDLAFEGLMSVRAGQRHAIIISDGDPSPPRAGTMKNYVDNKITVTTIMVIGHGSDFDRQRMQNIADQTGGRFYHIINPNNLPQIFIKEAQVVSRSLIQEGEFQPRVVSVMPGPIDGIRSVPGIGGYVLTTERDGLAQTPVVHVTEEGNDPIYAYWNYGLGRSIAFTSDAMGRWGTQWVSWADFMTFWSQSIRWAMRPSSPANMSINTRLEGDTAVIEVEALEADASFLNFLQTRAIVLQPDSTSQPVSLQQIGPGRYRGEFRVDQAGAYLANVHYSAGAAEEDKGNLQAAVSVPYSQEYRSLSHNAVVLRRLAEMTGGRVLRTDLPPADLDLFYRGELDVPRSPKHIWDLLAIIAAILFLLDVATRRIAVDGRRVREAILRAFGARGQASEQTVAAWKKTREQVAHRRAPTGTGAASATGGEADAPDRRTRFAAGEDDAASAIDVGQESEGRPHSDRAQPPARTDTSAEKPPEDEGPHTSRLLRAKRRARGEDSDGNV